MMSLRISTAARSDIAEVLSWSRDKFGDEARSRYEALIIAALEVGAC